MMTLRRSFGLLLIFLCGVLSFAQPSPSDAIFTRYTSDEGLSQQIVRALTQDKYGFIWIGTEDGLNKFNGYDFKVYRSIRNDNNSLPDNFVYSLAPARDGGVWIGTNSGGLAKYNPESDDFTRYQHDPNNDLTIGHNRVESIYEDKNGVVWIGTNGNGLNRLNTKTGEATRYPYTGDERGVSNNSVITIAEDSKGNIWIRTYSDIEKYDPASGTFETMNLAISIESADYFGSFYIDNEDVIWTTAGANVVRFDTKSKTSESIQFSNHADFSAALIDVFPFDEHYLWVSSYNGLFLFDKSDYSAKHYNHDEANINSISAGNCISLLQDNTGSLWAGTNSAGLNKLNLNRKKFKHFKYDNSVPYGLTGSVIKSLAIDSENNIWVSADSRLNKLVYNTAFENNYYRDTSSVYSELFSMLPNCIMEDSKGNIWIGSWGQGIKVLQGGDPYNTITIAPDTTDNSLIDDIVQAFLEDRSGNIWIGTELGLSLYNPENKKFRHFLYNPEDDNSLTELGVQANCIAEDIYGNIWVGTWGGLSCLIPEDPNSNTFDTDYNFKRYVSSEEGTTGLSDNRVISLCYDSGISPNTIFIGTYGSGMNQIIFDTTYQGNDQVKIFTRFEGLPNDVIYSIESDNNGKLWLSTNDGLVCFNVETEEIITYNVNDGLQANQFYWGAGAKSANGELLFGGINGFNMFDPSEIFSDTTLPKIVLTDLKILNKSVKVGEKINNNTILKRGINVIDKIKLTHKENMVTIEFAGLHYAFPKNNKYRYKLDGFDDDWIVSDGRMRFASYTNLDHGKYTFYVDAANYDGVWTEQPRELRIIVKAPFWQRWWFRILVVIILIYLGNKFYNSRIDRIKHDKEILEKKIKEGEKVIEQQVAEVEEQKAQIRLRDEEEQEIRFVNHGIVKFSELLSKTGDDLNKMSQSIISELVQYVGGISGVIYVMNEEENKNALELVGFYAIDEEKLDKTKIEIGEGYIGTCYQRGESIIVDNVPETYSQFSSGLGNSVPKSLCLIPIKQLDNLQGVIEITSFIKLDDYKVQFIEKIAENITSTISIAKANQRMNDLLENSKQQTEELRAQEEEMRLNMEEMIAAQEELQRQMDSSEELQKELNTAKALLDSLMNNLPDYVYFKDEDSKFIRISKSMLPLFPFDSIEEMVGKSDFDFHKKEAAQEFYDEEMKIIESGKGFIDKEVHEVTKNNVDQWVAVTKLPLYDEEGNCIGTFGISKDISERKKYQNLSEKLEKELKEKQMLIRELESKLKK